MKQIIEINIPNRKVALVAVAAAVLLLCISAAIPFTAAAFGKGFVPEETQPEAVEAVTAGVTSQDYAQVVAEREILKTEAAQKDEQILGLQEENQILRDALALSEDEGDELASLLEKCQTESAQFQALLTQVLSQYSRKYVLDVLVSGEVLGVFHMEWHDKAYVTEEEYLRYQQGNVLACHPEVGVPSIGSWTLTISDKYIIELEGID